GPAWGPAAPRGGPGATTGAEGGASVTPTAGTVAGNYVVTASVAGVGTPASFTLTNTPSPPTDIALSGSSVPENQPAGTTVGTFSTTDPDVGDTFTYTLVSGAGGTDNASDRQST